MGLPDHWDWKNPDYDLVWRLRMARLEAIRAEPERVPGLIDYYRDSPVDFINDWGVTFDPRIPLTMPFLLFPKQEEFVRWVVDRWKAREDGLVEKSRDMGISWCCVAISVWMWRFHNGTVVGFGSRKEDLVDKIGDPDSLFWKIRTFIDALPWEFKPKGYDNARHAPFMRVLNVPGESVIKGEAGKNIGRGGRTSIYFKDESAHYEQAESIDAALSQNTNVQIDVSTPNGEGNPFWQKRHGGKVKVFVFDWRDDPRKGKDWYEKEKLRLTPTALAAEVDRDYSASISNSFIPSQIVTMAMARGPADFRAAGPLRVGLDVARFGDDKCVLTFRRGRVVLKQVKWGKVGIEATAGRAKQEITTFHAGTGLFPEQIAVDVIGVGSGAADILRGWFKHLVVDVNAALVLSNGKHYNLRAFMWDQMKEWLEVSSLPNDQDLRVSLTALRYGYKGGELLLESKDDMKARGVKSPDEGDSLALTFAYPGTPNAPPPPIRADQIANYGVDPEMGM
jgi:phage terminase large subunit